MVPCFCTPLVSFFFFEGGYMKDFKSLSKESVDMVEGKILERWIKDDILDKCIENRND